MKIKAKIDGIKNTTNMDMCTPDKIISFSEIELQEDEKSQKSLFDIQYLLAVLNGLEQIGFEYITIRVENDKPMFITDDENNGNKLKGVLIAPRIYN